MDFVYVENVIGHSMQSNTSRKVFLNPSFKNTHINPNFLLPKPTNNIHVNPEFLQRLKAKDTNRNLGESENSNGSTSKLEAKLITKSRTKIVREPMKQNVIKVTDISPIIKISRTKLVRASAVNNKFCLQKNSDAQEASGSAISARGKYKIDRRILKKTPCDLKSIKKHAFVSKYALRRSSVSENLPCKKLVVTERRLLKIGAPNLSYVKGKFASVSVNKKLELLNINGVLYRSTKNKLQKADAANKQVTRASNKTPGGRAVFIKGDKFVLDKSGRSLTRVVVPNCEKMKLKRIDIGGLTYIAKSNNLFLRTENHKTRSHLSTAKQKSINTLSKNVVKTNIPCPIFRKVGKCASFERGKCPKVHDKKQVIICPRFLKGECTNEKCLLSHEVTLSKMPTCKFFLQGICVRENCPYLHKKLGGDAKVCIDFLRGFCRLADKCNKRHEFVCPDFERTGKCENPKCIYCIKSRRMSEEMVKQKDEKKQAKVHVIRKDDDLEEKSLTSRYFVDEDNLDVVDGIRMEKVIVQDSEMPNEANKESEVFFARRPKLGELPAFIPL